MLQSDPNRPPLSAESVATPPDHAQPAAVTPNHPTKNPSIAGQAVKQSLNNLALPRSPLIGRDHEIAVIQQLLLQEQVGLLTLTGPGGIGKTRLAMQVAANLLDHFIDGVYFISLAPISDPALVAQAIAQTLGVRESGGQPIQESLHAYLHDRQLLFVLDNFEQIVAAAPLVGELLTACSRLKILVTSRATLHLYGEQEFPVSPLALPDRKWLTQAALGTNVTQYAAIELFCQRASSVKPDFVLTASNATTVAEICIGLDGLPLAIELAAARIKLFSPSALLARLQDKLTLLTGGSHDLPARQRTLRAEIAWSYDLLTTAEQTLFRRLAVFVGGFTIEAAQTVGNPSTSSGQVLGVDVLKGVATLVDQNLLKQVAQSEGETRFGMLETIREYGLEQLEASGEAEAISRHHAHFFLALAEAVEPEMFRTQRAQALARLEADYDNLRAAFAWSQTEISDEEVALRLAGALAEFLMTHYHHNEARGWLVAALQRADKPTAARAKALWAAGLMAFMQGHYQVARTDLEGSIALWRKLGDQHGLAVALCELCGVAYFQHQGAEAQRYGEESVALFRATGNQLYIIRAIDNLAYALSAQGDYATARRLFEEEIALNSRFDIAWNHTNVMGGLGWLAGLQGDYGVAQTHLTEVLARCRAGGHKWSIAEALNMLGEVCQRQGDFAQAGNLYREGVLLARVMGDKAGIAHFLHHLGVLAQDQAQFARATCLLAVATGLRKLSGGTVYRTYTDRATRESALAKVRTILGKEAFAACWAQGEALSLEQAIEYALAAPKALEAAPPARTDNPILSPPSTHPAGLTAREVEVLRLLVEGLTYAQIADKLVISQRTVNVHLTSIYSKLGVTSRATATRFAEDHHLV